MTLLTIAKIAVALEGQPDVTLNSKSGRKQNIKSFPQGKGSNYTADNKGSPAFLEARDTKTKGR
jgi:hypothetical protein